MTALPYYVVIFTSIKNEDVNGYSEMAEAMEKLAAKQPGYLGFESATGTPNISISYWESLEAITSWKQHADHLFAQQLGKTQWYKKYRVRICKVEKDYDFSA